MDVDLNTLADTYLRHYALKRDEDVWAWEKVFETVRSGDVDRAWAITLLLLKKAGTDDALNYVAAGPLEDLIDGYGHAALDKIEEAANNDSRIQLALSQVGVLFYYNEFERWYNLLYRYGLKKDSAASSAVLSTALSIMDSYVKDRVNVHQYRVEMTALLDKPLADKAAQRILQQACEDVELFDSKRPPDYREPCSTEPDVKRRAAQALAELQSLGYGNEP